MRVLLDTYVLVRLSEQGITALSSKAQALFLDSDTERLLSTVSLTEIAVKRAIGKLQIEKPVLNKLIDRLALTVLPYSQQHAERLFDLPLLHREPFDRMLIATALAENIPILSVDREFKKYKGLKVVA